MSDTFPLLEVAKHATRDDAWVVIDGRVLDVTQFLDQHPGGEDILLSVAGRDATRDFEDVGHSADARERLDKLVVGSLRAPTVEEREAQAAATLHGGDEAARLGRAESDSRSFGKVLADRSSFLLPPGSPALKTAKAAAFTALTASAVAVVAVAVVGLQRYVVPTLRR